VQRPPRNFSGGPLSSNFLAMGLHEIAEFEETSPAPLSSNEVNEFRTSFCPPHDVLLQQPQMISFEPMEPISSFFSLVDQLEIPEIVDDVRLDRTNCAKTRNETVSMDGFHILSKRRLLLTYKTILITGLDV
jgi:hypothetical protein